MNKRVKQTLPIKSHTALVADWMKEPRFKAEYETLEGEYELFHEMLMARKLKFIDLSIYK